MKVLHVLGAYAPADFATGPPQQVHRLVCALRAGGADARVITTNTNGPTTLDVPAGRWTEHESVPVFYGRRVPGTFDLSFEGWRAVAREAGSYDLIHVTGIFSWVNLAAAAASRRRGVPVIVSPRGSLDPEGLKFSPRKKAVYFRFGGSRALNEAAGFHVTATRERDYVLALRPRVPVAVVPNGVTVLFLGRIHPKKNVIPLVRAWAAVLPHHAEARLVLAGPDDQGHSAEVHQTIAALGLEHSVSLAGLVVGDDLSRLLAMSRCLVLPSSKTSATWSRRPWPTAFPSSPRPARHGAVCASAVAAGGSRRPSKALPAHSERRSRPSLPSFRRWENGDGAG
jgi:glycosyltransferase involved in cell wall biosynthesis